MIYFGNKGSMQWVKAPTVDFDASRVGWTSQVQFLNGGTSVRSSVASHANVNLAWGLMSNEEARTILRPLRSGQPVYWVDPFVYNHLPQAWAEPWRAGYDGPILDNSDVRPKLVPLRRRDYASPCGSRSLLVTRCTSVQLGRSCPGQHSCRFSLTLAHRTT